MAINLMNNGKPLPGNGNKCEKNVYKGLPFTKKACIIYLY
jgi:hypothetical protein